MVLNDIWRTIGDEVGFFYEANFDEVPSSPGIYAWFYPLRILSRSEDELARFVSNVQALLNYDAVDRAAPSREAELPMSWWSWSIVAGKKPKPFHLSAPFKQAWIQIANSDELFLDFQQSLLKASILMPPLYVGKADNLNIRCGQHLSDTSGANTFHNRYEHFARHLNLPLRSVRQLIFACVRTGNQSQQGPHSVPQVHELIEGIMKSICAPPYGLY